MAPNFRHGKSSRLIVSTIDASSLLSEMTISNTANAEETTTFGASDRTYIQGLKEGTLSASGFLDVSTGGTNDPYKTFTQALGSTTPLIITAIPGGPGGSTVTPGAMARLGRANETALEIGAPAMGVVTAKFDAQIDGAFDFGRTVYGPAAAVTTTGAKTAVDFSTKVVTSGGGVTGVAHIHVTAQSTLGSITIAVQHSSAAGGTYSDLATFTTTSTGSQRTTVTNSTLKRYVRANVSAFTGGAGKSVRFVAAFARRSGIQ